MYFRRNWPWIVGTFLTLLIGCFAYVSAWLPACYETSAAVINCPTKWFYLKQSTPNELGDTLAGFAGALAFIWIIVTVAMQAMELSEQRKEFKKMADAQTKQVDLLIQQGEIFAEEQRQRKELETAELFLEICEDVFEFCRSLGYVRWFSDRPNSVESKINLEVEFDDSWGWEQKFDSLIHQYDSVDKLKWRCEDASLEPDISKPEYIVKLLESLGRVQELAPSLSEAMLHRYNRIDIISLVAHVQELDTNPVFWIPPVAEETR